MKISVGIVGYGNLGKAVENELLKNNKYRVVAIFSRRTTKSLHGTIVEPFENYIIYKNKIDVMILCGGSKSDIEVQAPKIAKLFDSINCFDTHKNIKSLTNNLNNICLSNNTRAIVACGWDPGIFSIVRGLLYAITENKPYTLWGKGISMGHSEAIRSIDGVVDGIEFTIPSSDAIKQIKHGESPPKNKLHYRKCYVLANKNLKEIEQKIKSIPNYFYGEQTTIEFVDKLKLLKLKSNLAHKGKILSSYKTSTNEFGFEFSLAMKSNPALTAKIMICYIKAIENFKRNSAHGAFTPIDIPISYLFDDCDRENLLDDIC